MRKPKQKLTRQALAKALGITPRHVYVLQRQGMPIDSVARAAAWRTSNIDGPDDGSDLNRLRGRVLARREELLAVEIAERTRTAIPADEVRNLLVTVGATLRSQLVQVVRRLQARFPVEMTKPMADAIAEEHAAALRTLAESVIRLGDEPA